MKQPDRNRLDRAPTRGERWVGVILSALLAVVFLPAAIFFYLKLPDPQEDQVGLTVFATVLAMIGITGAFLLYRFAFTKPQAASARAHQIYAKVAVVVAALLATVSVIWPVSTAQRVMSFGLLFVALGVLASTRKGGAGPERR